jgi:hypothetical protein
VDCWDCFIEKQGVFSKRAALRGRGGSSLSRAQAAAHCTSMLELPDNRMNLNIKAHACVCHCVMMQMTPLL